MTPPNGRFSAAGSALGYLAQIDYALLLALIRMDQEVSLRLSLETLDDITFEDLNTNTPAELWQTKHHVGRQGVLSDTSPDFWKTLHHWIVAASPECELVMFTTGISPEGSAASLLCTGAPERDRATARELLGEVARAGGNAGNHAYYAAYSALTAEDQLDLLRRVTVLDGQVKADQIGERLRASVRKAVRADRRDSLVERLSGWWHTRAIDHLVKVQRGIVDWIELDEIEGQLHRIADSLRDDNLPLDFGNLPRPTDAEVEQGDEVFVKQLRLIMLHHERIRDAVYDHHRAFLQRSRWQREQLLWVDELEDYDQRLIDEWRRVFLPISATPTSQTAEHDAEPAKVQQAQQQYAALQQRNLPEVRAAVRSGYIPYGSLHMLADELRIGWHPDYLVLLRDCIAEAQVA